MLRDGEAWRLVLGDALAVLPTLEGASFDCVLTDPPYPLVAGGRSYSIHAGGYFGDKGAVDREGGGLLFRTPKFSEWVPLLSGVCSPDAEALVFTNDRNLPALWDAFRECGWRWHNLIVWDKGVVVQNLHYMKQCEFVLYTYRGKSRRMRRNRSNLFRVLPPSKRVHDAEKPVELLASLVRGHHADLILDPFAGSGTTLVAAIHAGRRAVGIEIDPAYHAIAVKRLAEAANSAPLFDSAPTQGQLFGPP